MTANYKKHIEEQNELFLKGRKLHSKYRLHHNVQKRKRRCFHD